MKCVHEYYVSQIEQIYYQEPQQSISGIYMSRHMHQLHSKDHQGSKYLCNQKAQHLLFSIINIPII